MSLLFATARADESSKVRVVQPQDTLAATEVTQILGAPSSSNAVTKTRSIRKIEGAEAAPMAGLALRIQFALDSADVPPDARRQLDAVAEGIRALAGEPRILVEGHTDSSGPASHNEQLSRRRADAVRAYLIEHGVQGNSLEARGAGSREPLRSTDPAADANRRVEFRRMSP